MSSNILKYLLGILFFTIFFYPSSSQAATESIRIIRQDCTGYTNCYTSLSSWEAAENRDLTVSDEIAVARIEGAWTSADTTAVTIDGWTTDATRYIKIYTTSEARHGGVWSDAKYRLDVPANYTYVLSVLEPYTKIEGLQIRRNGGAGTRNIVYLNAAIIEFSSGIVTKSTTTTSSGINAYSAAAGTKVWNTIVYGVDEFGLQGSSSVYFYNNTVINPGTYGIRGVSYSGTAISCKNNLVKGSLSGDFYHAGSGTLTCVNSASADSTAMLYGASNLANKIFTFVDESNSNFHLSSSDASAINAGTDLSSDPNLPFSTDIDGETRSGSWDIGADEVLGVISPTYQCSDSIDNDSDGLIDYPNDPGCSSTTDNDETNIISDTTPPTRSNGSPSGSLASSTTSTTISLSTNETATCKYGTTPNVSYSSIASTFTSTNSTSHSQTISGLQNGQSYTYYIRCQDSANNQNSDDYTISFSVASLVADTQAPSIPTNLSATTISSSQVNLSWTASTDNTAVTGYKIYQNGAQIITTTNTSYSSVGLTASTAYSYTVSAYDAAGNNSGQTASVSATTSAQTTTTTGAPIILYTDIVSGPNTGGQNNKGVFVRVFGKNFGSTRGTSVVTIGGGAADNYPTWSDTEISFQLGANAQTGNIVVTTSNGASNGFSFTVRSGNIYFVDINSLNNPGSGTYTDPWRSALNFVEAAQPGDTMYMRAGIYTQEYGRTGWGAIFALQNGTGALRTRSGTQDMPIAYLAYPGEVVKLSAPGTTNNIARAFRLVATASTDPMIDWITIANFSIEAYNACIANGGNAGVWGVGWRIVNNDCLGLTITQQVQTGTIVPGSDYAKVLGNKIHGGRTGNKLDHAIYSQACGDQVELGWNHIYDNNFATGPLISINYEGTRCTTRGDGYAGNIYVHDNIIDATNYPSRGVYTFEQDWDDGDPILPVTYVYNNVFINTGTNSSDPVIGQSGALVVRNGGMEAYNNSFYNNYHTCLEFSGPTPNIEYMVFKNNICHMRSTATSYFGYIQNAPPTYDIRDNIYYGLGNYTGTLDVAPINADPLYSNPGAGDLTLQSGSPAIDKVSSLASALATRDFNGTSRPQGSAYDIGAYEYCIDCISTVVVTADTTPPSIPSNLSATPISSSQINLSWTASTDNTAVTGYRIYRSGTQIGTSSTTTYSNTGLTPSTLYTYTVAAVDGSGNISSQSSQASATTQAPPDTTAPTISNISSTTTTSSSTITFVTSEQSDTQIEYGLTTAYGQTTTLNTTLTVSHSQTISNLTPNTTYNYRIITKDSSNNTATSQNYTFTTQSIPDTTAPTTITDLAISNISQTSLTLSWTVPSDTSGIQSYDIRYNTSPITDSNFSTSTEVSNIPVPATSGTTQTQYISVGLTPSTTYYFAIKSRDSLSNQSNLSNTPQATTESAPSTQSQTPSTDPGTVSVVASGGGFIIYQVSDSTPPDTPSNFKANATNAQISLSWTNPQDFIRVKLMRKTDSYSTLNTDGTLIYEGTDQTFTDTNLQNNQTYYYSLYAYDSTPNYSTPAQISSVPTESITQIQTTTSTQTTSSTIKEGDLIRGPDKIKVYIVNHYGYKRHIFNPEIFNMYGHFKWENIKEVDQQTLDSYQTSDLYRADGDTKVFSLHEIDEAQGKAQKRWFNTSADKFTKLGYNFNQVFIINPKERDFYQEGTPITDDEESTTTTTLTLPTLAKTQDNPQVYFISANKIKKPILNETVFNSYTQNKWQDIKEVSQEQLDQYPTIQGILYQGKVYILDLTNKTKTPVQDEQEFNQKNLDWAKIMTVNETEVGEWR